MTGSGPREVCVLGLGLIGGSVLRAAVRAGRAAWGADASAEQVAGATAEGFDATTAIDAALARAAGRAALVVVAVPLTAIDPVLAAVHQHAPEVLLTDVTSVKAPVAARIAELAPRARYVGGHPMAGGTRSGWSASSAELFREAAWVACPDERATLGCWAEVARLALDAGAHVVPATAGEHDAAVARISHLPHLLAAALASVGAQGGPLALALGAGSYTDGTRVAGAPPELTRAMTEGNRDALLPALDAALGLLGAARTALVSTGSLEALITGGHEAAGQFSRGGDAGQAGVRIALAAPEAREALVALGARGGRVVALDDADPPVATAWL